MGKQVEELRVPDDGLVCGDVRWWAETKYRLVALYDRLFATGMKDKWDQRVYIDLYSGSGFGRVRDTAVVLKGSPILAIDIPHRFDKYIFCEEDHRLLNALRSRVERICPTADVSFIEGSCDSKVDEIIAAIPRASRDRHVLSLCFVDPFDFGLKFSTIQTLSKVYVDFLVLLAVGMDANRAYDHYVDGKNPKLDEALGNTDWRERWKSRPRSRDEFLNFVAEEFGSSMTSLGYRKIGPADMRLVKSDEKNLPLYYLALFSKSDVAYKYWKEVLKYGTDQMGFAWEESHG